ncbi:hypothetical protein [Kitasatospora sp. LaBMicrA B282]|uniref:hypothetical protein n=1 Tax=Kitasatospora sp. LaBMicrA B282 TaxID=3420949 RepID=UPI003D14AAC5
MDPDDASSDLWAPHGITVLGAAAGTGKTGVSIGLLRSLRRRGVPCEPFKAVAVVTPDDPAYTAVPPWQRGVLHNCSAAGLEVRWRHNPVVVDLPRVGALEGDLYVKGRLVGTAPVAGEDCLDPSALPGPLRRQCEDAVLEGYELTRAGGAWLLVEGAAGAGELDPGDDLANQVLPAHAGLPVVLVTNPRRSGHLAALSGLTRLLAPELAALLLGYVLNQVGGTPQAPLLAARLTAATGLPMLAAIANSPLPDGYDGSLQMLERLYDRRCRYVEASGLLERVPLPADHRSTPLPSLSTIEEFTP